MEKGIVSEEKKKPVLDEQTLAKLLEAAFVLQEHNRELREIELGLDLKRDKIEAEAKSQAKSEAKTKTESTPGAAAPAKPHPPASASPADYTFTLAQIVATQHQIQIRNLSLENAIALVTERVIEIARAGGAAIGMLEGKTMRYRAVSGSMTLKLGTEVPTEKALCLPCIRNAQVFRCADVNPEFLVDSEECRRRGIQSLIAVPIFHEGVAAGGLELYYSTPHGFTDQEVHTCQLMAGLVTEALARDEEHTWKLSLANERAAVLQAIEKLKPNLAALENKAPQKEQAASFVPTAAAAQVYACPQCGNRFIAGEQFCGQCGSPRGSVPGAQSKTPALPRMQNSDQVRTSELPAEAKTETKKELFPGNLQPIAEPIHSEEHLTDSLEEQMAELFAPYDAQAQQTHDTAGSTELLIPESAGGLDLTSLDHEVEASTATIPEEASLTKVPPAAADWSSAASAREFLEQLADGKERSALARFWDARRGDIYLAIAIILVACVIRWGIWSNHPVSATNTPNVATAGHRKPAPDTDLSYFDRMLISFGLAEAPAPPDDKGNPSIQVWVDLHTALYYCPGTDLYGKTSKGKYTTQRDAQLDEYQPAYRKVCN